MVKRVVLRIVLFLGSVVFWVSTIVSLFDLLVILGMTFGSIKPGVSMTVNISCYRWLLAMMLLVLTMAAVAMSVLRNNLLRRIGLGYLLIWFGAVTIYAVVAINWLWYRLPGFVLWIPDIELCALSSVVFLPILGILGRIIWLWDEKSHFSQLSAKASGWKYRSGMIVSSIMILILLTFVFAATQVWSSVNALGIGYDLTKVKNTKCHGEDLSVQVSVDPRVELFSIIFRLAGNREYCGGKTSPYVRDIEQYFGKFRDHPAVKLAARLRETKGISHDAPITLVVYLSDAYELKERVPLDPLPEGMDPRWSVQDARLFCSLARQFVEDTEFEDFISTHQPLYDRAIVRMKEVLWQYADMGWFERFFGSKSKTRYYVILAMGNEGHCYGPHFTDGGTREIYSILGCAGEKEDVPVLDERVIPGIIHEFCHSYANPLVETHITELEPAGKALFACVALAMKCQAYGTWQTLMYESLVRASTVRYFMDTQHSRSAAHAEINMNNFAGFVWVDDLSELLGEYEANRNKYPALDSFSPRIVEFFNAYSGDFQKKDALAPHVVKLVPENYAQDVDPGLKEIRIAFDKPMKNKVGLFALPGIRKPYWMEEQRTFVFPVKLQPNCSYQLVLSRKFQSENGYPLNYVFYRFSTRGGQ